jgi:hypothetical protein
MSEQNPGNPNQQPDPDGQEATISLQSISRNLLVHLQRQYDILAFTLANLRNEDPTAYDLTSAIARVMPAPKAHLTHAQMRAYSRGLLQRTAVNDLLQLSAAGLDQCHLLCAFIKEKGSQTAPNPEADQRVGQRQQAFARAKLQEKFETLETEFGIINELEDALFSLAAALRVLANGGQVTNDDISPDGTLVLDFKMVRDVEEDGKVQPKLTDVSRTFRPGEQLVLTDDELIGLNITVAKFLDNLFRSVDQYGTNALGGKNG